MKDHEQEPDQTVEQPVEPTPVEEPTTQKPEETAPAQNIDTLIEQAVEKALGRLDERIAEAEERGYRRAIDEARQRLDEKHTAEPSRTNFLASTRPDIWD